MGIFDVMKMLIPALAVVMSAPAHASSVSTSATKPVKLGALMFARWSTPLGDAEGINAFDIDRVYLTLRAGITPVLGTRVTLDVGRLSSQRLTIPDGEGGEQQEKIDTKLRAFLKYAYLEWKTPLAGTKLRVGAAGTPWVGYYDKLWGHRYVSKSFTDRFEIQDSADLGLQALGKHADGLVSWQAGVVNGTGYGSPEGDDAKAAHGRLSIDPLAGGAVSLPVSGFASYELGADGDPEIVVAGAIAAEHDYAVVWTEVVGRQTGDVAGLGLSATLMPRLPGVASLLLRVDRWDPDGDTADDGTTRYVAGVSRAFADKVGAALTYERTDRQSAPAEDAAFVRLQAGF